VTKTRPPVGGRQVNAARRIIAKEVANEKEFAVDGRPEYEQVARRSRFVLVKFTRQTSCPQAQEI
jgi:hypothetical protein